LAAFARAQDKLQVEGITTIAASTNPLEKARETVAEQGLTFAVGYGLPLKQTARDLGAFYDAQRGVLHGYGIRDPTASPDRGGAIQLRTDWAPGLAGCPRSRPVLQETGTVR